MITVKVRSSPSEHFSQANRYGFHCLNKCNAQSFALGGRKNAVLYALYRGKFSRNTGMTNVFSPISLDDPGDC